TPREVELAYVRAAARYGYGAYAASYSEDTTKAHTTTAPMTRLRGRGVWRRGLLLSPLAIRPRPRRAISGAFAFARGLCLAACTVFAARSVDRDGEGRDHIDHRHQGEEEEGRGRCAIPD